MNEITRVVIKRESGCRGSEDEYSETFTLTANSIAYEYRPRCASETRVPKAWAWESDDAAFAQSFAEIVQAMPAILNPASSCFRPDAGKNAFLVAFADNSRQTIVYYCPPGEFGAVFRAVRNLVPPGEVMPEMLKG